MRLVARLGGAALARWLWRMDVPLYRLGPVVFRLMIGWPPMERVR